MRGHKVQYVCLRRQVLFVLINSLNIDILKHGIASILLIRAELGSEPMIFLDDLKEMQGAREIPVTSLSPWSLNRLEI